MLFEHLMFSLARPAWLLAILPAVAVCWLLYQRSQRRSGWEAILPSAMQPRLLQRVASDRPRGRYLLLGCAWLLAIIALAGPSWSVPYKGDSTNHAAIVLVMEVTPAMLATDVTPSRLQRARHKVHDVIRLAADHRLALVAYAGSAHRVTPLSHDRSTLTNLLGALEPAIMPAEGNSLDAALTLAREMIADLPPASSQILLLTSSSNREQLDVLDRHAAELGPQLAILGIGTQAGAPVPNVDGGFQRDTAGRILVPRLDSQALAAVVRRHGGAYHRVTTTDDDLEQLLSLRQSPGAVQQGQQLVSREQGHWLLLLLLPIAALGARRGWLGVAVLIGVLPAPVEAAWADWWQRPDQQGAVLLEQRRPLEAAERFEDPAWKAWSLYQAKRFPAAVDAYADVVAREPENAAHHFHYGTALTMAERYEAALEAFEQALTRDPEHEAARHNRSKVEALLEALREQARQSGTDTPPGEGESDDRGDGSGDERETQSSQDSAAQDPSPQDTNAADDSAQQRSAESGEAGGDPVAGSAQDADAASSMNGGESGSGAATIDPVAAARQTEQAQALRQWLEEIPDNPAELLRRKFLYQHMQQQQGQQP
ncbi:VWA domain-containing protein [Halopseudomonas nanhaiensis]|uniref:VWA domain-containing protein n=1 Tax=Halopseudomonas nanhaiensis TaxID=2830842 RepID=UPI001CBDB9C1|nr:VWA domain-containing protein [Halopseudomonas nanhaiensis]UAW97079.1 VWA domain-containing protein [Halopseudomonas nanhaiensis]